jgi:hypothetical protein
MMTQINWRLMKNVTDRLNMYLCREASEQNQLVKPITRELLCDAISDVGCELVDAQTNSETQS